MSEENQLARVSKTSPEQAFAELVESWLVDKTDATRKTYQRDVEHFQKWVGASSSLELLTGLFALEPTHAYQVVDRYRTQMIKDGLAGTSINRKLSVLRSLSRRAAAAGLCKQPLFNEGVHGAKPSPERTKMISAKDWKTLIKYLKDRLKPPGKKKEYYARRDLAALRLLRDVGLRRKEVVTAHSVDFEAKTIRIFPKGPRGGTIDMPVAGEAWNCLLDWLELPPPAVSMFGWESLGSLNEHLRRLAERAGIPHVAPHMLRRAGITGALDCFNGDTRESMAFSRHKDSKTLAIYDKKDQTDAVRRAQRYLGEDRED